VTPLRPKIPGLYVAVVQLVTTCLQTGEEEIAIGVIDAHSRQVIICPSGTRPRGIMPYQDAQQLSNFVGPLARLSVN